MVFSVVLNSEFFSSVIITNNKNEGELFFNDQLGHVEITEPIQVLRKISFPT